MELSSFVAAELSSLSDAVACGPSQIKEQGDKFLKQAIKRANRADYE